MAPNGYHYVPKRPKKSYLVEFRFSGQAKYFIKNLKGHITKEFGVSKGKIIPHITLVGPIPPLDERKLIREVERIGRKYDPVKFWLDGFDKFRKNRVVYLNVKPSEELKAMRLELATSINTLANEWRYRKKSLLEKIAKKLYKSHLLPEFDYDGKDDFKFHTTLAMKDMPEKAVDIILKEIKGWNVPIPQTDQYVLRITILKNKKILREYDILQRRMLTRDEALDRNISKRTRRLLDKWLDTSGIHFEDISKEREVFVYSDTHFDHANIIGYSNRPFNDITEMNQRMVEKWNEMVTGRERIFFLGDMCYGHGRRSIDHWLGMLNGNIQFIKGNHDTDSITGAKVVHNNYGITYDGYKFLLMHQPDRPPGYNGWIIHGDKHNNDPDKYPMINQKNRTINVSAEMTNYAPVGLDILIMKIETGRDYTTIND